MTTYGSRIVPDSIAGDLPDLFTIKRDLLTVRNYCLRIVDEWQDSRTADWIVVHGLSEAALIRYARCFAEGRRLKLKPSSVDQGLLEFHEGLRRFRNEHVAHPVNDYEEGLATVQVVEPPDPRDVGNVGMGHARIEGFTQATAEALVRLSDSLLSKLDARIKQERQSVQDDVDGLPPEEVYSWPTPGPFSPSGGQRQS